MPFHNIFRKVAPFVVLLIPLIIIIPGWDGFVYSPRSIYSDVSISHYPNASFLIKSLQQGQLPLWSSTILVGYPFAADPLAGIWYLPGWIAYFFPLPLGFNINVLLHFLFNGIGMWCFLRAVGIDEMPSLVGAVAWELFPKIFAHFGAGHLSLIYAISWTPWLMLAEYKADHKKPDLWVGILLGTIALADVRWLAYAGVTWFSYSIWMFFRNPEARILNIKFLNIARTRLRDFCWTIVLSMMIAAPLIIPLFEFTQASTRRSLSIEDNLTLAITPIQLFGILAPNFQGYAEWMAYSGGAILIGVIWAIFHRSLRVRVLLWLVLMTAALLLSLGGSFPLNNWIARLPGWDLLRVPSRFMLIFGFSGIVVFAYFLNMTLEDWKSSKQFWGNLISFGLAAFTWIIVVGLWLVTGQPVWSYIWSASVITFCVAIFMTYKNGLLSKQTFLIVLLAGVVLDLGAVSHSGFTYRQDAVVFSDGAQAADSIKDPSGIFRFYSPSYSISQQTAWIFGLESIHGIDPLQLKVLSNFLEPAIGIPMADYSVTIPPYTEDDPKTSNLQSQPDAGLLGLLNVKYVLSEYPIDRPDLTEWKVVGKTRIYLNEKWRTRAWIQPDDVDRTTWKPAIVEFYSPNMVTLRSDGPGTLVLSDVNYPGWQVLVDGIPKEIVTIFGLFRGVNLDAGSHQIDFVFRPVTLPIGLAFSVVAWFLVFYLMKRRTKN